MRLAVARINGLLMALNMANDANTVASGNPSGGRGGASISMVEYCSALLILMDQCMAKGVNANVFGKPSGG